MHRGGRVARRKLAADVAAVREAAAVAARRVRDLAPERFLDPGLYRDLWDIYPAWPAASRREWDAAALRGHQRRRLAALLRAAGRAPHYGRAFREAGVALPVTEAAAFKALGRLPILTRADLARLDADLWTEPDADAWALEVRSGGSTGARRRILRPPRAAAVADALTVLRRYRAWGLRRPSRVLLLLYGGHESFLAYHHGFHAYAVRDPRSGPLVIDELDPHVVMASPPVLRRLARERADGRLRLASLRFTIAFSELLDGATRRAIRAGTGRPVYDLYSGSELSCNLAWECPTSGLLHVNADAAVVEVPADDGRAAEAGEVGRVIATDLVNDVMPIVRYETGDLAAPGPPCPCGRALPTLVRIEGRIKDRIPGRTPTTLRALLDALDVPGPGALEIDVAPADGSLTLAWDRDSAPPAEERARLAERARSLVGAPSARSALADDLRRSRTGKYVVVARADPEDDDASALHAEGSDAEGSDAEGGDLASDAVG